MHSLCAGVRPGRACRGGLEQNGVSRGTPMTWHFIRCLFDAYSILFDVTDLIRSYSTDQENRKTGKSKKACPACSTPRHCHAARAALRLAHEQPRAEHARHPHCTPASLASDAHALPQQHALTRKMLGSVLESLATGWPSAGSPLAHPARTRSANTLAACSAREPHASPTCCACCPLPIVQI